MAVKAMGQEAVEVQPKVIGQEAVEVQEGTLPTLKHAPTAQSLAESQKNQKKQIMAGKIGILLGVVCLALTIVGLTTQTDPNCETEPVHWKDWYLGHTIVICLALVLTSLTLRALKLIQNENVMKSQIHQAKGKEEEATRDLEAGQAELGRGLSLIMKVGCCLCATSCFNLAWFFFGIVLLTRSGDPACDSSPAWFGVLFGAATALQCLQTCFKPKTQQPQMADAAAGIAP